MRWYDYITYNIYWLGLNIATGSLTPIILPFLVAQFVGDAVKGTYLGVLRSAGLIMAIMIQPMAGLLSDRSTAKWGRRRPYILVGTLLDLVFLAVIGLAGNYWLLFVGVLALQFSSNVAHGALQGIIPDLVPEDQRGRASGVKAMMELLPIGLVSFVVGPLVSSGRVGTVILIVMGSLLVTMLITVFAVHEVPLARGSTEPLGPPLLRLVYLTAIFTAVTTLAGALVGMVGRLLAGQGVLQLVAVGLAGLVAMAGAIVLGVWWSARVGIGPAADQYRAFTWWVVDRLLYLSAIGSIQGFAQYYLKDVMHVPDAPAAMGNLVLVVGLFTVVSAVASGWLADRLGRKMLAAIAGMVAAAGTFLLLTASSMGLVMVCGAIIGLSTGLFMTTNWALGTQLVPAEEAGLFLGISNLAGAGAGVIGAGIGGPMADFFNRYSAGLGWRVIFAIYAALFALSALVLLRVRERGGRVTI